jgi:hypothetical protein
MRIADYLLGLTLILTDHLKAAKMIIELSASFRLEVLIKIFSILKTIRLWEYNIDI